MSEPLPTANPPVEPSVEPAVAQPPVTAPEGTRPSFGVHLRRTEENVAEIDALAEIAGGRAGIAGTLANLDLRARRARWVPGRLAKQGFTWNLKDRTTRRWYPQGVTTSADASDTEEIDGRRLLATSWYSKGPHGFAQGSRVSFVNLATLDYRHVLLVQPQVKGGADRPEVAIKPLNVHAGGIVWCGPYLHVAATARGIYTCRVDDIMRVPDELWDPDPTRFGGQDDGRLATYGYQFVWPVRFRYEAFADDGAERMRYSFLSLDRSSDPPVLVAGEYGRRKEQTTRLSTFPLDPETLHLRSSDDGLSRPLWLAERGERGMQGAASVRNRWYITSSLGVLGSLYVGTPGRARKHRWSLPPGPEDIAWWPSRNVFWSLSELPLLRWVFFIERDEVDAHD